MDKTVEPWQAKAISRGLFPGANYLIRLRTRMEKAGVSPKDEVYQLVCRTQETMQNLYVAVHYRSCSSGVGRPAEAAPAGGATRLGGPSTWRFLLAALTPSW